MNKLLLVVIGIVALFSTATAFADPREDLLKALLVGDIALAEKIVDEQIARRNTRDTTPLKDAFLGHEIAEGDYAGANVLWLTGYLGHWHLVKKMLRHAELWESQKIFEQSPVGFDDILQLAAENEQLDILGYLLHGIWLDSLWDGFEGDDPATLATEKWSLAHLVAFAAARGNRWDVVETLVAHHNDVDLNYSLIQDGVERNGVHDWGRRSVLARAAMAGYWDDLDFFFKMNPELDIAEAYLRPRDLGWILDENDEVQDVVQEFRHENAIRGLGRLVIRRLALPRPTIHQLRDLLTIPIGNEGGAQLDIVVERFRKIFRDAARGYLSTWELNDLSVLPYDLRMKLALDEVTPEVEAMDVGILPDSCLMQVLKNFQCVENPVPEYVVCRVLALRFPFHKRASGDAFYFFEASMIRDAVYDGLGDFLTKRPLMPAHREFVARIIAAIPINALAPNTMRDLCETFMSMTGDLHVREEKLRELYADVFLGRWAPQPLLEDSAERGEPLPKKQRELLTEENANIDPDGQTMRALLTREVAAGAPALNHHEIAERVNEIMDNGNETQLVQADMRDEDLRYKARVQGAVNELARPAAALAAAFWWYTTHVSTLQK